MSSRAERGTSQAILWAKIVRFFATLRMTALLSSRAQRGTSRKSSRRSQRQSNEANEILLHLHDDQQKPSRPLHWRDQQPRASSLAAPARRDRRLHQKVPPGSPGLPRNLPRHPRRPRARNRTQRLAPEQKERARGTIEPEVERSFWDTLSAFGRSFRQGDVA